MATKKKDKSGGETSGTTTKKCNILCWILVSALVAVFAAASYKAYQTFLMVPDMPEIELHKFWGPSSSKPDLSIRPYRIIFSDSNSCNHIIPGTVVFLLQYNALVVSFLPDFGEAKGRMLENIRRKFENYRSMTKVKSLTESSSYGLNSEIVAQVFAHWQFKYNYRQRVRYLNKFDHFKTIIQGLDIHFVHVKPEVGPNVKVVPILLLHGWPTSVREFYEIIPTLTSENSKYDFVFEVIAPSLPGFIYSQAPVRPGLSGYEMAIIMRNLMERLGFKQFYVHGGDIGHIIGTHMATIFPDRVLGFHTSFPVNLDKCAQIAWALGEMIYNDGNKKQLFAEKLANYLEETGYFHLQSTKPDTIGTVLQDSPVGLAAYIIDRIFAFTDPITKEMPDVGLSTFNTTDLIDNVLLYWTSGSITTSLRFFRENIENSEIEHTLASIPTTVPTWGLRTKNDLLHQSDTILQWKYKNLIGTTNLDVGGHYPALEIPDEVAKDIYKAVKNFRNLPKQK